jgi:hypothetical protein
MGASIVVCPPIAAFPNQHQATTPGADREGSPELRVACGMPLTLTRACYQYARGVPGAGAFGIGGDERMELERIIGL